MTTQQKRSSGSVVFDGGEKWRVLTESSGEGGKGFTHNCGTEILGKDVLCTVRDGLFPLSGGGEVRKVTVPYCPNCELEPQNTGEISAKGEVLIFANLRS